MNRERSAYTPKRPFHSSSKMLLPGLDVGGGSQPIHLGSTMADLPASAAMSRRVTGRSGRGGFALNTASSRSVGPALEPRPTRNNCTPCGFGDVTAHRSFVAL